MMNSRERRLSLWSNATCAVPMCEALTSCRGQRAHHAQMDRVGTWDIPRFRISSLFSLFSFTIFFDASKTNFSRGGVGGPPLRDHLWQVPVTRNGEIDPGDNDPPPKDDPGG